jgi:hypothetical protein
MPLPTGEQTFTYDPVVAPILSDDPAQAKPIGVGAVANGGNTLDITLSLEKFSGPVDVAFGLYSARIDPAHAFFLDSDYSVKAEDGNDIGKKGRRIIWKTRIRNLSEALLLDVPVSEIPKGQYTLILEVSPSDDASAANHDENEGGDNDSQGNGWGKSGSHHDSGNQATHDEENYYRWITTFQIK